MNVVLQGCELRDRTSEAQQFRIAGLNLPAAIMVGWNTEQLGRAVKEREPAGLATPLELLRYIPLLGWTRILPTGEYGWRKLGTERPQRTVLRSSGTNP